MTAATANQRVEQWRDPLQVVLDGFCAMTTARDSSRPTGSMEKDIAAAKSGDGDAFARLIGIHQATITQQMVRFSRNKNEIEELVHDVFVEAFMSLKSYRAQAPLIHWLRKIAVRVGYRFWKNQSIKKNRMQELGEGNELASLDHVVNDGDSDHAFVNDGLHELLSRLAPRDRMVLTLIYWDECTVAEAASLTGWTKTMVKVQAHRARKRLRRLIEDSRE